MNGKVKIIGTNKITNFLQLEEDENASIKYEKGIHTVIFKEKKYLLDMKQTVIYEDHLILWGWLSNSAFAGQICIQFFPKNA